jgi:hypothetical protein
LKKFLIILILIPFSFKSQSFDFQSISKKKKLTVGEAVEIDLKLTIPADKIYDTVYFKLSENGDSLLDNWELWNKSKLEKSSIENETGNFLITYSQKISVANFDTGQFVFPSALAFVDSTIAYSNSIEFSVLFDDIDEKSSIKQEKPIKETTISWYEYVLYFLSKYAWWIIGIALSLVLLFIILKRFNKKTKETISAPSIPIEITLLETLSKIEKQKYWENGYYKKYYSELSNILWKFLEYRYQIKTFEKTSSEILEALKWSSLPNNFTPSIERFFEISDGVKFAKQSSLEKDNISAIKTIRDLIKEERQDLIPEIKNTEHNE